MSKSCTEDYRALDVRKINRAGRLTPGSACSWVWSRNGETVATINMLAGIDSVTLNYRQRAHGGEWKDMVYPVRLAYTPCNLGGHRVWWQCPAAGCNRRVAVLYGGTGIFACRHCYRLAYRSQRETGSYRPADKLRARLGWVPGIAHPPGGKPKGMHWKTYTRLLNDYHRHVNRAWDAVSDKLVILMAQMGRIKI
ncbi:MAG: hypothetical protein ABIR56_18895 [Polaromonas sp.]